MPRPDEVTAIAAIFWHLRRFGSVVMEPHNSFTLTTNLLKSCPPCVNINWGTGSKSRKYHLTLQSVCPMTRRCGSPTLRRRTHDRFITDYFSPPDNHDKKASYYDIKPCPCRSDNAGGIAQARVSLDLDSRHEHRLPLLFELEGHDGHGNQ